MGTRESVVESRSHTTPRPPDPPDHLNVVIEARGPWTAKPDHIINLFCGQGYVPSPISNVGVDFNKRSVIIDEGMICVAIWNRLIKDGIRYTLLQKRYVGCMVMYDVRDERTFEVAKKLITVDIHDQGYDVPVVLVGCQCQQKEKRQVSYRTAREFADEWKIPVVEVCGKEGVNVELAFMTLLGEIHSKRPFPDLNSFSS